MPAEDRDRQFENALARHLRADAAASDSACLDPELLAAYHERMLAPDEMNVAKDHLVSCARCQEILAQLEATENVQALQNVEADLIVARAASRSNAADVVEEASSMPAAAQAALEPKRKIAAFPPRKNLLLRWAAPAGAIAAVLLLWIGVREFRSPAKSALQSAQIADNRAKASPDLDAVPAAPQPAENEKAEYSNNEAYMARSVAPPVASPRDELRNSPSAGNLGDRLRADKKALPPSPKGLSQLSSVPAPPTGHGEGAGSAPRAEAGAPGGNIVAKTDQAQSGDQSIEVQSDQSQIALQQNQINQQVIGAARAAGPPAAPASTKEKQSKIVTAGAPASAFEMKDSNQPAALNKALYNPSALPSMVMAPDGKGRWRFGASGGIAHSSDAGQTWQPQSSGVTATLSNASAPSDKVCWIAGAAGTLLFTKDGGKHWKIITTPIAGDLGGVRASDSMHASIWDLPNRMAYKTSDGGATWKQSASEKP